MLVSFVLFANSLTMGKFIVGKFIVYFWKIVRPKICPLLCMSNLSVCFTCSYYIKFGHDCVRCWRHELTPFDFRRMYIVLASVFLPLSLHASDFFIISSSLLFDQQSISLLSCVCAIYDKYMLEWRCTRHHELTSFWSWFQKPFRPFVSASVKLVFRMKNAILI